MVATALLSSHLFIASFCQLRAAEVFRVTCAKTLPEVERAEPANLVFGTTSDCFFEEVE